MCNIDKSVALLISEHICGTYFVSVLATHKRKGDRPDDGGSTHLWNVVLLHRNYTELYSRKLSSSYSPQMSQTRFCPCWELKSDRLAQSRFSEWTSSV
jgi:hypothetical protein